MPDIEPGTARAVLAEAGFVDYPRPWIEHAARCLEKDGAYADYSGFCSWFSDLTSNAPDHAMYDELHEFWEGGEFPHIALYALLSELKWAEDG